MKINPDNRYVQKYFNFDHEQWDDEIIKNNPSCVFHLIEIVKNNPDDENNFFSKINLDFL